MKYKTKVPPAWAIILAKQYQVLLHADAGIVRFDPIAAGSDLAQGAKDGVLEAKNVAKDVRAAKDELLRAKEEMLAVYRQLLSQAQDTLAAATYKRNLLT